MTKRKKSNTLNNKDTAINLEEYVESQFKNKNFKKIKSDELNVKKYDETRAIWNTNNRIVNLFADSVKNDNKLKNKYACIILLILGIQLLAMYVIFALVGTGTLEYNNTTLNIFISGGILETFALVRIVVVNLFNDNLIESLNIILENNNKGLNNIKKSKVDDKKIADINNEVNNLVKKVKDINQ